MHLWFGGTVCHRCGLRKKITSTGWMLYLVDDRWISKTPKCVEEKFAVSKHRYIEIEGSSVIEAVSYDPDTLKLDVKIKDKTQLYRYANVSHYEFIQFILSKSVGKLYNSIVKTKKCTKLRRTDL